MGHRSAPVRSMQTARGRLVFPPLRFQLLAERKAADALSGRGEDGVHQRRREWRDTGLADAARRRVGSWRHDVEGGHNRGFVHPEHLEVVEVLLLPLAVLEGDLAVFGETEPHDSRALDL